jgi:hypothetical protein
MFNTPSLVIEFSCSYVRGYILHVSFSIDIGTSTWEKKTVFVSESMSDTTLLPLSLPDLQHFQQQPTTQTHLIHPTNQQPRKTDLKTINPTAEKHGI